MCKMRSPGKGTKVGGMKMVKIHRCIYCGELPHDTPRKNKNCELRHRSKFQTPAAPGVQAVLPQKFDESAVFSAYLSWKSSFEEE